MAVDLGLGCSTTTSGIDPLSGWGDSPASVSDTSSGDRSSGRKVLIMARAAWLTKVAIGPNAPLVVRHRGVATSKQPS